MFVEVRNSKIQLTYNEVNKNISSSMHKHSYAEIHIILDGYATFKTENAVISLKTTEAVLLPENKYHSVEGTGFQ